MTNLQDAIAGVLNRSERCAVICARVEDVEPLLPDGCANLIPIDGPYHGVKGDDWDNEHDDEQDFLAWKGERYAAWKRILAPNGTLYDFASPRMGARVEVACREHFAVIANVRWQKPKHSTKAEMFVKEALRAPFPASETIVIAEQRGSDDAARAEAGYDASCEAAKRATFGDYLRGEMMRAGVSAKELARLFPSRTGGLTGCVFNWLQGLNCPTAEQWDKIRERLNEGGHDTYLRREYEELRREYEELRRPFNVTADDQYTDVWTYPTVPHRPGKHPCEKPEAMARDIVRISSRPDDLVLVFFSGSGVFAAEALKQGRRVIAVDMDPHWCEATRQRCAGVAGAILPVTMTQTTQTTAPVSIAPTRQQLSLF